MPVNKLSDIGARGLVVHDGEKYFYVLEETWRNMVAPKPPPNAPELVSLRAAVAVLAAEPINVFVNLNEISFGDAETRAASGDKPPSGTQSSRRVVLHDNDKYYEIPDAAWSTIDENSAGDARVLVKRGALVAAIPKNTIPSGTWCVLVNLKSLTRYAG
jgi:hypothetical protein